MSSRFRVCVRFGFSVLLLAAAMTLKSSTPVQAAIGTWPSEFHDRQMAVSGGTQYVRVGGRGPAVLLLHGFGDTGDMWIPLAEILVKDHTVIVPDLRGMGLSSHQDGGYEKIAQARDLAGILDELGVQTVAS
jgi:alpha-beta hydrolase superfamily lysophospholipase